MSGCKMCVRVAVFEAYYFFLFLCILIFVLPFLIVPYLVYLSSLCHSFSFFFFFKAEDGIRYIGVDWSSDVCSSDLTVGLVLLVVAGVVALGTVVFRFLPQLTLSTESGIEARRNAARAGGPPVAAGAAGPPAEIGRASCRERV